MSAARSISPFLDYEKSLACIHCGLCLSSCPTYLETGNENDSPRGRVYLMRALQDGRLALDEATTRHIDLCLGCRACEAACPSGVQYGALLESTRDHIEHHQRRPVAQAFLRRVIIEQVFPRPWLMRLALLPARFFKKAGAEHLLPAFAREALSLVPDNVTAATLPEISPVAPAALKGRVGLVGGCVMSVMFGDTNRNTVRLLNAAGYEVVTPGDQGCCGALFAHGGNLEAARESARQNIAAFERHKLDAIIINAAGCGSTLKEYGHLLHDDARWAERAAFFSARVKDVTEWLAEAKLPCRAGGFGRVTYHDACHLAHAQRITQPPRELVKAVAGRDFVELPESDVCCGSAGSYNLTEPEMAARLQRRKIDHLLGTGADTVVTSNPGCLLQIQAGLTKAGGRPIRVLHIVDFLAEALEGKPG